MASRVDITEAFQVGGAAARLLSRGTAARWWACAAFPTTRTSAPPSCSDIHTIANFEKKVPGEWITPDGVG